MPGRILIIATLDTKAEECAFARDLVRARGHQPVVLDAGVLAEPPFAPEVRAAEVAEAGGNTLSGLRRAG